jgi:predicted DNA-binding transcriptional regulator YafY
VATVEGNIRTFRISRIQAVGVSEDRFERPPDFDLAAYWQRSSDEFVANLPRYPATVRVATTAAEGVREAGWVVQIEFEKPSDANGWVEMALRFEVVEEACRFVLSFGPQMEVLEPSELREHVAERAAAMAALYAQTG